MRELADWYVIALPQIRSLSLREAQRLFGVAGCRHRPFFCQKESLVGWARVLQGWSCDAMGPSHAHLCTSVMLIIKMVMLIFLLVKCLVVLFLPNHIEACEAREMEQMEGLHFGDFTLSFTKWLTSVILLTSCTASFAYICSARLLIFAYMCCGQTQAEAHYKGHKHARKLKALETQRNQQKRGHSPFTSGRDKEDQDTTKPGERTTSLVSHLRKDITGINLFWAKPSSFSKDFLVISDRSTKAW